MIVSEPLSKIPAFGLFYSMQEEEKPKMRIGKEFDRLQSINLKLLQIR